MAKKRLDPTAVIVLSGFGLAVLIVGVVATVNREPRQNAGQPLQANSPASRQQLEIELSPSYLLELLAEKMEKSAEAASDEGPKDALELLELLKSQGIEIDGHSPLFDLRGGWGFSSLPKATSRGSKSGEKTTSWTQC